MKKLLIFCCVAACAMTACAPKTQAPKTFLWNGDQIATVKASLAKGEGIYAEAYDALLKRADRSLDMANPSVMDKEHTPASGDKHDYESLSRYFWPNPDTEDGLPYVTRDGESNPELAEYDRNRLGDMTGAVTNLSLAFYLSGDTKYSDKALSLLRTWFLDPATKMNPNMNYAQIVPGLYDGMGRSYGIIDGYGFVSMLDGVQLLDAAGVFPPDELAALKGWFATYSAWLVESDHGRKESSVANNHSIAYDVQLLMYSLFGGATDIARKVVDEFPTRRLQPQIAPDGSQPHELTRTIAYWYSVYNLAHILDVCDMASRSMGIDLFNAPTTADGSGSIKKAVDFLTPFIGKQKEWPYPQIHDWEGAERLMIQCLYRAAKYSPQSGYVDIYRTHATTDGTFILVN